MGAFDKKFLILLMAIAGWLVIPELIPQVHAAGYGLLVIPSRTQESDSPGVLLVINVTGASIGTTYKFTFQVTDPSGSMKQGTNQTAAGGATSTSFVLSINYPNGPGFGTHLNYVGNYTINVQQNNPTNIPSVARGQFLVGLTDQVSYHRTFTVSIVARGYNNNSPVNIDIAQGGSSAPGYPKTLTTSGTGTLSTTWVIPASLHTGPWTVSLTGSPVKTVADIQAFTVYPTNVTISQLNLNQTSLQRTQTESFSFTPSYLSGSPVQTGGTNIRVTESDGTTSFNVAANYSSTLGAYFAAYKIRINDPAGSWNATIDPNSFNDGYGNGGPSTGVAKGFTVYPTNVTVSLLNLSQTTLTRTETESFSFTASYPNGSPVQTGGTNIRITEPGGVTSFHVVANYSSTLGAFVASYKVQTVDPVGSWTATIDSNSFNDGYGNGGPSTSVVRGFTVLPTNVTISVLNLSLATLTRTDMESFSFTASYPNGSPVQTGGTNIRITEPGGVTSFHVVANYSSTLGAFVASYKVQTVDPVGSWTATIDSNSFNDGYGNGGPSTSVAKGFTVYSTNVTVSLLNLSQTTLTRTETESFSFTASYLNGAPVTTGGTSIRITEADGTTSFHVAANYSSTLGAFVGVYGVQTIDPVGYWTATIDLNTFNDGYGNGGPSTSVARGFTVFPTNVTISRLNLSQSTMTRTETESFSFTASYLNGVPVTTGGTVIKVTESDGTTSFPITANYSSASGAYVANYRIRPQDQAGSWVAVIDPATFNDGYGNGGPITTIVRGFTVQPASLSVVLSISNQTYTVGEGVPIYARVTYPDGSVFTNGNVTVTLSSNGSDFKSSIPLTYVPAQARWATVYTATSIDPSGLWLVTVDALDAYANSGTQTGSAVVSVPPPTPPPAQNGPFTTSTFVVLAGIVGATALLALLMLRRKAKGTAMKLDLTVVDNEVDKIKSGEFYQNIKKQMEETEPARGGEPPSGAGEKKDNPTP